MKYFIVTCLGILLWVSSYSATQNLRLVYHPFALQLVDSSFIDVISINSTKGSAKPFLAEYELNDSLNLKIVNEDSVTRNLAIDGLQISQQVFAGDSVSVIVHLNQEGVFQIYDLGSVSKSYTVIAGLLAVRSASYTTKTYYWNIRAFQKDWHEEIKLSGQLDFTSYNPDYFTVNNLSNPNTNLDAETRVVGHVGDTIRLVVANTGYSTHSMHFHGYHLRIINSIKTPLRKNWIKDTFPVYPGEVLELELIPDKPGVYPVHDHNLIGVTGGRTYPNGMFTTLKIDP